MQKMYFPQEKHDVGYKIKINRNKLRGVGKNLKN